MEITKNQILRPDGRRADELRPIKVTRDFIGYALGSVLIEVGNTKVICTVMKDEKVPSFQKSKNKGWVTAEYEMLPAANADRKSRNRGKVDGRTMEIQRLVGRSLRSVVDLTSLGERTLWVDCDVIQADGGTRAASITGAFIALYDACTRLLADGLISEMPITAFVAATSVGIRQDDILLDLCYEEDSTAEADVNMVMTEFGEIIEIQGTGGTTLTKTELEKMLTFGEAEYNGHRLSKSRVS